MHICGSVERLGRLPNAVIKIGRYENVKNRNDGQRFNTSSLEFFYTYITAKESHFFLSELSSNCHFLQICWKTRKITAVTVCVLAVSCVSLWASCHCWERLHSHVSHSRCFVLLVWSHSVLMSLSALFPFCTSTPCHTTPTTSTYHWESQSALCSVCLTLCHCCPCKVYSLILCANNAPVYLLSAFFSCYLLLFLLLFLSAKKKKRKKMGCAINPCSFPMEPLVKYCSFFTFWYFILHIADFRV